MEKQPVQESERYYADEKNSQHVIGDSASDKAALAEFSPAEEKRLMHKIDRRLVLTVGVMYCISLMDRTNLGGKLNGSQLSSVFNLYVLEFETYAESI